MILWEGDRVLVLLDAQRGVSVTLQRGRGCATGWMWDWETQGPAVLSLSIISACAQASSVPHPSSSHAGDGAAPALPLADPPGSTTATGRGDLQGRGQQEIPTSTPRSKEEAEAEP